MQSAALSEHHKDCSMVVVEMVSTAERLYPNSKGGQTHL